MVGVPLGPCFRRLDMGAWLDPGKDPEQPASLPPPPGLLGTAALCPPARLGPLLGAPRPTTASTLTSVRPDAAPEVIHIHVPTVGKCQRLAINMERKPPLGGRAWYTPRAGVSAVEGGAWVRLWGKFPPGRWAQE